MNQDRVWVKPALVVFGLVVGLLAAELGMRLYILARYTYDAGEALGPGRSKTFPWTSERDWARYDPLLGWSPRPEARARGVTIGPQGFRGEAVYQLPKPRGRRRVVVLGDSYTFGYLVGDDQTFSAQLDVLLRGRAEVANLGVSGYGIDQMLLRLERDGLPLKPDLVVFSLITDDLRRAQRVVTPLGYGKPRFVLQGDRLELINVPPPQPLRPGQPLGMERPSWREAVRMFFGLHPVSVDALREALIAGDRTEFSPLHAALFRRLRDDCRAAGVSLLVLMIPTAADEPLAAPEAHKRLVSFLDSEGMAALDLRDPAYTLPKYFIYGHPDPAGHRFIAEALSAVIARRGLLR